MRRLARRLTRGCRLARGRGSSPLRVAARAGRDKAGPCKLAPHLLDRPAEQPRDVGLREAEPRRRRRPACSRRRRAAARSSARGRRGRARRSRRPRGRAARRRALRPWTAISSLDRQHRRRRVAAHGARTRTVAARSRRWWRISPSTQRARYAGSSARDGSQRSTARTSASAPTWARSSGRSPRPAYRRATRRASGRWASIRRRRSSPARSLLDRNHRRRKKKDISEKFPYRDRSTWVHISSRWTNERVGRGAWPGGRAVVVAAFALGRAPLRPRSPTGGVVRAGPAGAAVAPPVVVVPAPAAPPLPTVVVAAPACRAGRPGRAECARKRGFNGDTTGSIGRRVRPPSRRRRPLRPDADGRAPPRRQPAVQGARHRQPRSRPRRSADACPAPDAASPGPPAADTGGNTAGDNSSGITPDPSQDRHRPLHRSVWIWNWSWNCDPSTVPAVPAPPAGSTIWIWNWQWDCPGGRSGACGRGSLGLRPVQRRGLDPDREPGERRRRDAVERRGLERRERSTPSPRRRGAAQPALPPPPVPPSLPPVLPPLPVFSMPSIPPPPTVDVQRELAGVVPALRGATAGALEPGRRQSSQAAGTPQSRAACEAAAARAQARASCGTGRSRRSSPARSRGSSSRQSEPRRRPARTRSRRARLAARASPSAPELAARAVRAVEPRGRRRVRLVRARRRRVGADGLADRRADVSRLRFAEQHPPGHAAGPSQTERRPARSSRLVPGSCPRWAAATAAARSTS